MLLADRLRTVVPVSNAALGQGAGWMDPGPARREPNPYVCNTYNRGYRRKWTKDNGFVGRLMRRVVAWGWGCDYCLALVG